uniref:Uncharacterized protein n=1 Tax=Schistocephalus solidus TaxID=70667 RepID=A0A0X3Q4E9_SCHSO
MFNNYRICLLFGLLLFTVTDIYGRNSEHYTQPTISEDLKDKTGLKDFPTKLLDDVITENVKVEEDITDGPAATESIAKAGTAMAVTEEELFSGLGDWSTTSTSPVSSTDISTAKTEELTEASIANHSLGQQSENYPQLTIPKERIDTTMQTDFQTTLLEDATTEDLNVGDSPVTIEAIAETMAAEITTTEEGLSVLEDLRNTSTFPISSNDFSTAIPNESTETSIANESLSQKSGNDTQLTMPEDVNGTTRLTEFPTTLLEDAISEDLVVGEAVTDSFPTTEAIPEITGVKTKTTEEAFSESDVWSTTTTSITELSTAIPDDPTEVSSPFPSNDSLVESNDTLTTEKMPNQTLLLEVTTTIRPSRPPPHPCLTDIDEGEPEFQRYVCVGNVVVSYFATVFLLTLILFGVIKNITVHGCLQLLDVRRSGVSFPQRPEVFVLLCSTLPLIFSTIARPIFWPYHPRYYQFINELGLMQARLFFDLFTRTASVYHLVYWAYRMPIIRFIWRSYLRFKAFRAVWTKEHIIEVLQDKFAPPKDTRLQRAFQNNPEYMYFYAQFLQSGLPMQYLQLLNKSGARSPVDMSNAGFDGLPLPGQPGSSSKHSPKRQGTESKSDVLQRVNLSSLMVPGTEVNPQRNSDYASFLGTPSSSMNKMQAPPTLHIPSTQLSRGPSFMGSQPGRFSPNVSPSGGDQLDKVFGQHLSPDDALLFKDLMRPSIDGRTSYSPDARMPKFPSQEFYPAMFAGFDTLDAPEKKKEEEEVVKVPPPTREFVYICKHAIPGVIYILSLIITFPSIFAIDNYQYECTLLQVYFFYDMLFIVLLPMVAIIVAFYHGALASVQMNGGPKMRFRLRCYYVNFVVFNIPILILMLTITGLRWTDSHQMENERFATGTILALTVYHTNFAIKSTAYATGCNCICCSVACLQRCPRLNNCIVRMTTPKVKSDQPSGPYASSTVIQVLHAETDA